MKQLLRIAIFAAAALPPGACASAAQGDMQSGAPAVQTEDPRPFSAAHDAMADVDAALEAADEHGTKALLILGGNWCHDSRALAGKAQEEPLKSLLAENYELVWVDVGMRNRNLDVAERFGVMQIVNTPTVLVIGADEQLLNADSVRSLRDAHDRPVESIAAYFEQWAAK